MRDARKKVREESASRSSAFSAFKMADGEAAADNIGL